MERKELINEVVNFCFALGIFKNPLKTGEIKESIESQLDDVVFVENLISTVFNKARDRKLLTDRAMDLLIELEKIRIRLEQKDFNKS